jgi:uncharacterized protein
MKIGGFLVKVKFLQKHPVVTSVLWALLLLVFYFAAGFTISVTKASDTNAMFIRAACVFASCLLGVISIWQSKHSFSEFAFKGLTIKSVKKVLYFFPIIAIEVVPLFAGFRDDNNLLYMLAVLACTLCVGFAEELYFRGFIFNTLKIKGMQFAIIVSSVLFGLTHLINIAGGAGVGETILQIFFAFFFGFVCAEILILTDSILPIMLWHTLHDFLAFTTNDGSRTFSIAGAATQTVILITFGVYFFILVKKQNPLRAAPAETIQLK